MRRRRRTGSLLALGLAALSAALVTTTPAGAQTTPTGVGTSSGSTELVRVRIGDGALDVRVGRETSDTSNDTSAGPASASESVVPLTVGSSLVPNLGALSTPPITVASSGDERSTTAPAIDLGTLAAASPVPGLLDGTVRPLSLRAVVDALGSIADASGGASGISVLGGVLRVGELDALLGSDALVHGAGAERSLSLDRVEVLDLDAVLQLLGLGVDDLPLGVAAGLLQQLGLPLPAGLTSVDALLAQVQTLVSQAGNVPAQLDALGDQLVALQAQVAAATAQLAPLLPQLGCNVLDPLPILGGLTCAALQSTAASLQATISTLNAQIATLTAQIDALLDTVAGLLTPVVAIVDGLVQGLTTAPLLTVEDISLDVIADAVDTVAASTADVRGSIGSIRVGNLPPIAGADVVALANQATATLGSVLAVIDPALGSLVDIDLLAEATSVRAEGTKTIADAAVTVLRVAITPPDLCGLLGRLPAVGQTIGGLLTSLGQSLPALPLPVTDVLGDLGSTITCTVIAPAGAVPALTQPLRVEVLSVSGLSQFAAVPTQQVPSTTTTTTTPGTTTPLPRTGAKLPLGLLGGAVAAALVVRRVLLRAA